MLLLHNKHVRGKLTIEEDELSCKKGEKRTKEE